jgi:hypothetical protein
MYPRKHASNGGPQPWWLSTQPISHQCYGVSPASERASPTQPAPGLKQPSEVLPENGLGGLPRFLPPAEDSMNPCDP